MFGVYKTKYKKEKTESHEKGSTYPQPPNPDKVMSNYLYPDKAVSIYPYPSHPVVSIYPHLVVYLPPPTPIWQSSV